MNHKPLIFITNDDGVRAKGLQKLIDRGTRMVADELGIGYERARGLLLLHGSASKAIEAGRDGKMPEREADV